MINQIYEGACEERGAKKPGPSSSRSVFTNLNHFVKVLLLLEAFAKTEPPLMPVHLKKKKTFFFKSVPISGLHLIICAQFFMIMSFQTRERGLDQI